MATKISVIKGDITKLKVDAMVNAANSSLLGGGGVDGAIHHAGGSAILDECMQISARQGGCKTGEAVATSAGNLSAKKVIHTVGPVYRNGEDMQAILLANCYKNSLALAADNDCKTIAFPNISTGVYGYPKEEAAIIATSTITDLINKYNFEEVVFICFDEENYALYNKLLAETK